MSLVINDGAVAPVAHTFLLELAQQGPNIPAQYIDRSPGLGPKSFLRMEALSRFAKSSGNDQTQLHLLANHYSDPGSGVIQNTGSFNGWFNVNTTGTCSTEAVRKLYGMLLVNALANTTVRDSIFKIQPLNM